MEIKPTTAEATTPVIKAALISPGVMSFNLKTPAPTMMGVGKQKGKPCCCFAGQANGASGSHGSPGAGNTGDDGKCLGKPDEQAAEQGQVLDVLNTGGPAVYPVEKDAHYNQQGAD